MQLKDTAEPQLAYALLWTLGFSAAAPQLAFPINSQIPPLAFASQPYGFVFSETTFTSSAPQISYAITDGPKWLELDSNARKFSGVPDASAVGVTNFELVASDTTGQTSTSITFIVAAAPKLGVQAPILPQLIQGGPTSSPDSVLVQPEQPFELMFTKDTFSGATVQTQYYAVSVDNTPLPSWVHFDKENFTLSGSAPALVSSSGGPLSYGVRLIASDVPGFSEVAIDFTLVVNQHAFGFTSATQLVDISPDVHFQTTPLLPLLSLNGKNATRDQIQSVEADAPAWVALDKSQIILSGTPIDSVNTTVLITVTDIYGDVARASVTLRANGGGIEDLGTIASLNVTAGQYFAYTLTSPPFSQAVHAVLDLDNDSNWLHFDTRDWTLSGDVPLDQDDNSLFVPLRFENGTQVSRGVIRLDVLQKLGPTPALTSQFSSTQATPQATTSSTPRVAPISVSGQGARIRHILVVVLATVLSVTMCLILILLLLCFNRRKRNRKSTKNSGDGSPQAVESQSNGSLRGTMPSSEMIGMATAQRSPPPRPPRLDLLWQNDSIRQSRQRLSSSARPGPLAQHRISQLISGQSRINEQIDVATSCPAMVDITPNLAEATLHPLRPPSAVVSRGTRDAHSEHRLSSRLSRQGTLPPIVGLPDTRSGAGHGAGVLIGPLDGASNRTSWHNTMLSNISSDATRTTVVLESFPIPPGDESELSVPPAKTTKPVSLLRIVSEDSQEEMSFEEQRQRWHTERARARARLEGSSRFSNAGSARSRTSLRPTWAFKSDKPDGNHEVHASNMTPDIESRQHSWSKWSGIGPAAQDAAFVKGASGSSLQNTSAVKDAPSVASSGQFESVTSTESQWEDDENLVVEATDHGARRWRTDSSSQTSPRLPFSPVPHTRENFGGSGQQRISVADRRRHVSVEEAGLKRSYGTQRGSFRFI